MGTKIISQVKPKMVVLDTETTGVNPHTCKLLGIAQNVDGKISYGTDLEIPAKSFIVGHNYKYDQIVLSRHGFNPPSINFDTLVAYYLLHIDKPKKLETVVKEVFGVDKEDLVQTYNKSTGEKRVNLPDDWYDHIDKGLLAEYSMQDVLWIGKLYEHLKKELSERPELEKWFYEIEMPLLDILFKMETKGVKVNRLKLQALSDELTLQIKDLEKRLIHLAGIPNFNLNSPLQLRELLFKKFKLPVTDKTAKGEPSTDKATIKELSKKHPHAFLDSFVKYKEYSKIQSTYTTTLIEKLDNNDRMHTSYNQALTNTRRFSSDSPNLQNIPTRSELGKKIKECFVPEAGYNFLIADYSQLEPRILAHLSEDKWLIERFINNEDIYNYTTELVKNAGFKEFSRDKSKILFLALMYGKSAYGLASDWHCSEQEAQSIIDAVFSKLQGVRGYIDQIQQTTFKTGGWLKSIAGLPLYVGNPHSNNKWECAEVDRKAINYPIQSSSQDILKKAIVNIYQGSDNLFYPVLMVHDELVYEMGFFDGKEVSPSQIRWIIKHMENAWKLKVPLKAEYKISDRWEK